MFGPAFTRRQATADAQVEVQGALAKRLADHIESTRLDPDTLEMLMTCGGKMSVANLANIMSKALPMLSEGAAPSLVSEDWIANWRDKARLFSDEEMTLLWAQLLANETNSPGSKSRKAVNVLADLEPEDAKLFRALSDFRLLRIRTLPFTFPGAPPPARSRFNTAPNPPLLVVLDPQNELYSARGVDFRVPSPLGKLGAGESCAARIRNRPRENSLVPFERGFDIDSRITNSPGASIPDDSRSPVDRVVLSSGIPGRVSRVSCRILAVPEHCRE